MTAANSATLRQLLRELKAVRGQLDWQIVSIEGYTADRTALKRRLYKKPLS